VLAGNHDVTRDDSRGSTPYLTTMGPQRFKHSKTFAGSDPTGYNTAHIFEAAGQQWLLLALDWRMTAQGFRVGRQVHQDHPKMPVISPPTTSSVPRTTTTCTRTRPATRRTTPSSSAYGQQIWDELVNDNDQVFLTLNGHYWPPGG